MDMGKVDEYTAEVQRLVVLSSFTGEGSATGLQ